MPYKTYWDDNKIIYSKNSEKIKSKMRLDSVQAVK